MPPPPLPPLPPPLPPTPPSASAPSSASPPTSSSSAPAPGTGAYSFAPPPLPTQGMYQPPGLPPLPPAVGGYGGYPPVPPIPPPAPPAPPVPPSWSGGPPPLPPSSSGGGTGSGELWTPPPHVSVACHSRRWPFACLIVSRLSCVVFRLPLVVDVSVVARVVAAMILSVVLVLFEKCFFICFLPPTCCSLSLGSDSESAVGEGLSPAKVFCPLRSLELRSLPRPLETHPKTTTCMPPRAHAPPFPLCVLCRLRATPPTPEHAGISTHVAPQPSVPAPAAR